MTAEPAGRPLRAQSRRKPPERSQIHACHRRGRGRSGMSPRPRALDRSLPSVSGFPGGDPVHRASSRRTRNHRRRRRVNGPPRNRSGRPATGTRLQIARRTTRLGRSVHRERACTGRRYTQPLTSTRPPTRHAATHPPLPSATSTTPTPEPPYCRSRARVDCATRSLTRAQNNGRRAGVRRDERASTPRLLHRSIRRSLVHVADSAARWR